jgi:hypothetical protein
MRLIRFVDHEEECMRRRSLTLPAVVLGIVVISAAAQEPPPAPAFKAVHLTNLTPPQVAALQAWMADMNAVIAKGGHADIGYRLYKVTGTQAGKYEYMWESSWPSGDVYATIHNSPEWKAVAGRHPGLEALMKDEIYNRYVEVMPEKR